MKVIILPHDKAVAKYAYKLVMDRMSNGINAIGLPCGRAPLKLYGEIANGFKRGSLISQASASSTRRNSSA
ncbi:MAG: hypothetical protein IKN52_04910 [Victivallales bacterium]|nr:hypothetical protein [Victivallales bacterium]